MSANVKTERADAIKQVIDLTPENMNRIVGQLPRKAAYVVQALSTLQHGSIELTLPDGQVLRHHGTEPGPHAVAKLRNWGIIKRLMLHGSLGIAESYIEGEWESPDVTAFLHMFLANSYGGGAEGFFDRHPVLNLINKLTHWLNRNSKSGSKRNISAHYDLGNEFYAEWLDPSMTYSSALFEEGANSLEKAQAAKYRSLANRIDIQPHHHVLEIGCGWGGFAEFVAKEIGARVTCLTISKEQYDFAVQRIKDAGLDHLVTIKFQDYRDEKQVYDRIGSIEMFEAVGEKYWATYFKKLQNCLKPGGRAGLQVITIRDEDFSYYKSNPDFIQKYIFPGGMLPSAQIMRDLGTDVNLKQVSTRAFGLDYAATLEEWRIKFWERWEAIKPMGFDERFKRIWEFYFHYCEAGFKAGSIDVRQIVFEKAAVTKAG